MPEKIVGPLERNRLLATVTFSASSGRSDAPELNWIIAPSVLTNVLWAITHVLDVLVARRLGVDLAAIDGDRRAAAVVDVGEVVVDDAVPLADHADAAGALLVLAEEEVALDRRVVAVPQRERGPHVAKRVVAVGVVARLVGDRLVLAVDALEQVVLHDA